MRALTIEGRTSDDDVRWLAEHAAGKENILEIGPYKGRSTTAMAEACSGTVYAIDNWNASINNGKPDEAAHIACMENLYDFLCSKKVVLLQQDSRMGPINLPVDLRFDMLWIDGDHTKDAVLSDIYNFAPLVKPGGLVCGHDYSVHHPEVIEAVDAIYGKARVQTLGIHRSIWWVTA